MRNGIMLDILTNVDIVEIVKSGAIILEVFDGFFCHNLEYNTYTEFVTDPFEKENCFNHKEKIYYKT